MREEKKHTIYTATDIYRYLNGEMPPAEMHALEKAALDDSFLSEAMEGYTNATEVESKKNLAQLKGNFTEKENARIISIAAFKWLKYAAAVLLIITTVGITYLFTNNQRNTESKVLADLTQKKDTAENKLTALDSNNSFPSIETAKTKKTIPQNFDLANTSPNSTLSSHATSIADSSFIYRPDNATVYKNNHLNSEVASNDNAQKEIETVPLQSVPAVGNNARSNNAVTEPNDDKYFNTQQNTFKKQAGSDEKAIAQNQTTENKAQKKLGKNADASLNKDLANVTLNAVVVTNAVAARKQSKMVSAVSKVKARDIEKVVGAKTDGITSKRETAEKNIVEVAPADGWEKYKRYLLTNNRLPDSLKIKYGGQATELSFLIKKNGKITKIKVVKPVCSFCDAEAIRLLKEGSSWKNNSGKKVLSTLSVSF